MAAHEGDMKEVLRLVFISADLFKPQRITSKSILQIMMAPDAKLRQYTTEPLAEER